MGTTAIEEEEEKRKRILNTNVSRPEEQNYIF